MDTHGVLISHLQLSTLKFQGMLDNIAKYFPEILFINMNMSIFQLSYPRQLWSRKMISSRSKVMSDLQLGKCTGWLVQYPSKGPIGLEPFVAPGTPTPLIVGAPQMSHSCGCGVWTSSTIGPPAPLPAWIWNTNLEGGASTLHNCAKLFNTDSIAAWFLNK